MKGAATIEELRRAVETLKRNDRRTREDLRDIRDVINDFEWRYAPNASARSLPTDVIPPPPPGANPSGAVAFLRRFFLRFTRAK
jgi:hypothetical protein